MITYSVYLQEVFATTISAENTGEALKQVGVLLANRTISPTNPNNPPNIKLVPET